MLVCPVSKGELHYRAETDELWCAQSALAYPIDDGIPVMISDKARQLTAAELESIQ